MPHARSLPRIRAALGVAIAAVAVAASCAQQAVIRSSAAAGSGGGGAGGSTAASSSASGTGAAPSCETSTGTGGCAGADLMSDPMNCGACGRDCQGSTCSQGFCLPVTLVPSDVVFTDTGASFVADEAYVYYTTHGGDVYRCAVGGCGGTPTLVAQGQQGASQITVDASALYWQVGVGDDQFALMKCPLAGCAEGPTTLVSSISIESRGYASDGAWVYYTDTGIMKVPVGGGAPVTLVPGVVSGFAIDATAVYFASGACLGRVNKDGTGLDACFIQEDMLDDTIGVDAGSVYWVGKDAACASSTCLYRAGKDGSGVTLVAAAGPSDGEIQSLVVSGCNAYWTQMYLDGAQETWAVSVGDRPLWPGPGEGGGLVLGIAGNSTSVFFWQPEQPQLQPKQAGGLVKVAR